MEVCRVNEVRQASVSECDSFIDRAGCGVVHLEHGVNSGRGVPGRNSAIFACENEQRRGAVDSKRTGIVEYLSGYGAARGCQRRGDVDNQGLWRSSAVVKGSQTCNVVGYPKR